MSNGEAITKSTQFGGSTLEYTLRRQRRVDLKITVHPDLSVEVCAPTQRSDSEIEAKVRAKGSWITKQRLRFETLHPLPVAKNYVSGESFRYLGRQYRLRLVERSVPAVALRRPFLVVEHRPEATGQDVEQMVLGWYRARADIMLPRYVDQAYSAYPTLRPHVGPLRIRRMARRWGSCTPRGVISLNPDLMQASPACIEYVIVHELCHRHQMNHGQSFHRLLSELMPDWRQRRERLNLSL